MRVKRVKTFRGHGGTQYTLHIAPVITWDEFRKGNCPFCLGTLEAHQRPKNPISNIVHRHDLTPAYRRWWRRIERRRAVAVARAAVMVRKRRAKAPSP